jgi:hypothetical protein
MDFLTQAFAAEKNCCDKECNYGGETMSCGTSQGCFQLFTSSVTTPQERRANKSVL